MPKETIDCDVIERAIRKAVDAIPGIREITESHYCEVYLEALDVIKAGLEMRQEELENDEE